MLCVLSERRLSALIRQLENLSPEAYTDEEIKERMGAFATKVFAHIANFGVRLAGLIKVRDGFGDFKIALTDPPYQQGDLRQSFVDGLALLNPLSITVEKDDLPRLVPNAMTRAAMVDCWPNIAAQLTAILPNELLSKLEDAACKLILAPRPEPTNPGRRANDAIYSPDTEGFEEWCVRNNLAIPGGPQKLREAAQQRQAEAQKRANEAWWKANQ